jgi:acyl-CoA reductase-like NAD-dependent aldehyde dehydrogenase
LHDSRTQPFSTESARCRSAQLAWQALPLRQRLAPIRELRHLLVENADRLTKAVSADVFRNPNEVLATDLLPVAAAMQWLAKRAEAILKPKKLGSPPLWLMSCRDTIYHRPHGGVGVIGTWNYPIFLNAIPIAHALAAGNGVLWKPSEYAPRSASVLHELFMMAGVPADLLQLLPATREAGPQLAEADLDFLQFTGSDGVGRKLASRLGERLIPSILELSGVDACVILPDADPILAAKAVWFGTSLNAGQTCLAVRRLFVHESIRQRFLDALRPLAESGPAVSLVLPSQKQFLEDTIAAHRATGGIALTRTDESSPGASYLLDPDRETAVDRAACFAPITTVRSFDSTDGLMRRLAEHPYGLSCSIFTADPARAEGLAPLLRVGSVVINDVIVATARPETPFGGRGLSGWGVTQGEEGLLAMTVPQVVTIRRGMFRPHFDTAATGKDTQAIIRGILEATHSRSWWSRLKAMGRTVVAMMRS